MRDSYRITLTEKAQNDLMKIPKKFASHILDKLEFFEKTQNPLHYAKKLERYTIWSISI